MAYRDELQAALDRAEAAERRLEAVCAVHPHTPVSAACARCRKHLCSACVMVSIAGTFCGGCFVEERNREWRRRMVVVTLGVGAIVTSVLGAIWFWRPPPPQIAAVIPVAVQSDDEMLTQMGQRLATEPCHKPLALEVADRSNRALRFADTVALADRFFAECGSFPQLLWPTYFAHMQREEWPRAVERAAQLIINEPDDMDFWWWRGQALEKAGSKVEAAADYRQAMALGARGNLPWRLAEVTDHPCEGLYAFRADELDPSDVRAVRHKLWECTTLAATGAVSIAAQGVHPVLVGGTRGKFAVDLEAGLVLVTRAFAAELEVVPRGETIWVLAHGKVLAGNPATVPSLTLGGASAPSVEVAIVDELPEGLDGIIGQSFFWRFDLAHDAAGLHLAARGPLAN